jgi:hypothetical protein
MVFWGVFQVNTVADKTKLELKADKTERRVIRWFFHDFNLLSQFSIVKFPFGIFSSFVKYLRK